MKIFSMVIATGIVILSINFVNAQDIGFLNFKNGDKIEAEIKGFHSADKTIKYKNVVTGKKGKVKSNILESMVFITQGDSLIFERKNMKYVSGFGKLKTEKDPVWVAKVYSTAKMEGYFYIASDYTLSPGAFGQMKGDNFLSSALAIKIISEDHVFFIGLTTIEGLGGDRTARILMNKRLKIYLENYCPSFSENMNKNSYEVTELNKFIDDYTAQCK